MDYTLNDFMKDVRQEFYYYEGSLTTPECNEVVNWLVMMQVQPCNNDQFEVITDKLKNNYRITNPLSGRKVYQTQNKKENVIINKEEKESNLHTRYIILGLILLVLVVGYFLHLMQRRKRQNELQSIIQPNVYNQMI